MIIFPTHKILYLLSFHWPGLQGYRVGLVWIAGLSVCGVALFDTHVFLLSDYFIELNTANFKILNKFLNWILSDNWQMNQILNWILLEINKWIKFWIEFCRKTEKWINIWIDFVRKRMINFWIEFCRKTDKWIIFELNSVKEVNKIRNFELNFVEKSSF